MADVYELSPVLKSYDWGSVDAIPSLLGIPSTGEPIAEAWWGAHPTFPSMAQVGGRDVPLTALIGADADGELGPEVASRWAGTLPYLVKVLGVARPLSIQVHPSGAQAAAGFDAEERAGIPVGGVARSFRDRSHKPELLVALTEMSVLVGFRPVQDVAEDLRRIGGEQALALRALLEEGDDDFTAYTRAVLAVPHEAEVLAALAEDVDDTASASHRAAAYALKHHPGDPGALLALALNAVRLSPGQAIFSGAGVVHSYQCGIGLEVMANSDNVVRAGLTSKPIDVDLLCALADMAPRAVVDVTSTEADDVETFDTPSDEFRLAMLDKATARFQPGPHVVIALDGDVRVSTDNDAVVLERGGAVFVGHREGDIAVVSHARAAVVCAGIAAG